MVENIGKANFAGNGTFNTNPLSDAQMGSSISLIPTFSPVPGVKTATLGNF